MGNDLKAAGGVVCTGATAIAAAVTLGQVDGINQAVEECAEYTADAFCESVTANVGAAAVDATGTAALGLATVATLGKMDTLNENLCGLAGFTRRRTRRSFELAPQAADDVTIVGYARGVAEYVVGDKEEGNRVMKRATRNMGVIAGSAVGSSLGPAGLVVCGIAGGAVMDGATTVVESEIKGGFTHPIGACIKNVSEIAEGVGEEDPQKIIGGVVDSMTAPVMYGFGGYIHSGS